MTPKILKIQLYKVWFTTALNLASYAEHYPGINKIYAVGKIWLSKSRTNSMCINLSFHLFFKLNSKLISPDDMHSNPQNSWRLKEVQFIIFLRYECVLSYCTEIFAWAVKRSNRTIIHFNWALLTTPMA